MEQNQELNISKIKEIEADIEDYQQAIENAECALAEAERELEEELGKYRENQI